MPSRSGEQALPGSSTGQHKGQAQGLPAQNSQLCQRCSVRSRLHLHPVRSHSPACLLCCAALSAALCCCAGTARW